MPRVIVVGDLHTLVLRREEVVALFRETEAAVRQEPGCLRYTFAEAVGEPGRYVVVQEWRDEGSMRAHYRSEAFAGYQARIEDLLARPSEVRIHLLAETIRPEPSGPMNPARAD